MSTFIPKRTSPRSQKNRHAAIEEIAARLELSFKTVETYKSRALEKLNLKTRAEIVRLASVQGWLDDV
jgi:DNA-binding NarL/FixJ family response regulator